MVSVHPKPANYSRFVKSHLLLDGTSSILTEERDKSASRLTILSLSFVGVVILNYVDPALLLSIYGVCCSAFAIGVSQAPGKAGVGCLFALFFFESICYPVSSPSHHPPRAQTRIFTGPHSQCIFTLGTKNLGIYTKKGSGLIVMVRLLTLASYGALFFSRMLRYLQFVGSRRWGVVSSSTGFYCKPQRPEVILSSAVWISCHDCLCCVSGIAHNLKKLDRN